MLFSIATAPPAALAVMAPPVAVMSAKVSEPAAVDKEKFPTEVPEIGPEMEPWVALTGPPVEVRLIDPPVMLPPPVMERGVVLMALKVPAMLIAPSFCTAGAVMVRLLSEATVTPAATVTVCVGVVIDTGAPSSLSVPAPAKLTLPLGDGVIPIVPPTELTVAPVPAVVMVRSGAAAPLSNRMFDAPVLVTCAPLPNDEFALLKRTDELPPMVCVVPAPNKIFEPAAAPSRNTLEAEKV